MLLHSPYYASRPAELADGVMVPGQAGPVAFGGPVTILVCRGNIGVLDLSELVKTAAGEGRGSTASAEAVVIRDAEEALEGANAAPLSGHVVFLLYLNDKTFLDAGGAVARLGIFIAMVHEQDPSCGGVPFRNFFQQTPQVIKDRKLYDTVAVPLYRRVSLRLVLRGMGAAPCSAGMLRRQWQLHRRRIAVARLRDAAHARFRYGLQYPEGPRQKSQKGGVQEDSSGELSVECSASSNTSSLPLPVVVECGPRILP